MEIIETTIKDVFALKPKVLGDSRGYFYESFRQDVFEKLGLSYQFVQDNQSMSKKGILRGLHFQSPPHEQGKLIRVINGAIIDVVVDIRKDSPTYGQHVKIELNAENKLLFWVPPGFAHGFITLEDDTIVSYKCTAYYNRESEGSIRWNSQSLGIEWAVANPQLSEKDREAVLFEDFKSQF